MVKVRLRKSEKAEEGHVIEINTGTETVSQFIASKYGAAQLEKDAEYGLRVRLQQNEAKGKNAAGESVERDLDVLCAKLDALNVDYQVSNWKKGEATGNVNTRIESKLREIIAEMLGKKPEDVTAEEIEKGKKYL